MWEARRLAIRRRRLRLERWPAELRGFRVAVASDLHAGALWIDPAALERLARRLRRLRPDVTVLLGDFVDAKHAGDRGASPEAIGRALAGLDAFAVLGNHDWLTDGPRIAAALRANGIAVLEDEAREAAGAWIAAVGDASTRGPDVEAALRDVPDGAPVILLAHDPDVFPRVPERVALTLAGHTHGGQVAVPGLRRWWIPSRFGERYAAGHIVEGGRHLFVTTGVGTSSWPLRLGARPEIVLLELRRARRPPRRGVGRRALTSPRAGPRS